VSRRGPNWADFGDPASGDWTGRPPVLDRGRRLFVGAGLVVIVTATAAVLWLLNR
jgi:hypothetical protein